MAITSLHSGPHKKKKNLWNTLEISKQIHLSEQVPRRQLLAYSCRGLFLETEVSAAYPSYWKIPLSTGLIQNSFSELCFTSFPHSLLSPKLSHRILPEEQNTLIPCAAQHLDKKAISTQVACLLLSPEITPLPEEWGSHCCGCPGCCLIASSWVRFALGTVRGCAQR